MPGHDDAGLPAPVPERHPAIDARRRFSGEEVDDILRRASVHEVHGPLSDDGDASLADLMAAAEEVGLDPALVRRAASLEADPGRRMADAVLGAPDHREVRAWVPSTRLPARRQDLVRAAEQIMGARGEVQDSDPERFHWREDHLWGRTSVSLERSASGTEVRVAADRAGHYAGLFLGGLTGWALLSGLTPLGGLLGALGPVGVVGGFIALPLLLARPFWSRSDRKVRHKLERLAMELARIADEAHDEGGGPPAPPRAEEIGGA